MSQAGQQDFARRLRALRAARGLTQRQLAGDALSVSYVSLLESGRRTPTPETLRTLAAALRVTTEELTGEVGSAASRPTALNVRFGQLALEDGDGPKAQEFFEAALAAHDLDPLLSTEALIGRARALEAQGQLDAAAQVYEALVQQAIDAPSYIASLSVVISWCGCLYEMGELRRVTEVGIAALERLDKLKAWQSDTAIELLATVAAAFFELGDVGQAQRLLEEGRTKAEQLGSPRARAAVLWNASHIASERGRHREALELAEEALAYFKHGSDRRAAARLLGTYGFLLLRQEPPRPEEAREVLEEALRDLADTGRGYDRGYVLTELSRAHLMLGEVRQAVAAARESMDQLGPEAVLERARAQTALAAALARSGDNDEARRIFGLAADTLNSLKATRQAARAWVELGNVLAATGDATAAIAAFRHATAAVNLAENPGGGPRQLSADLT
ncbi:MAG TPA: helix-turn-helix transcriptional regulator [Pseudonocardiaceae bacterium]